MKKLPLTFTFIFILLMSVNAQLIRVNGVESFIATDSNTYDPTLSAEDIRKIKLKKYLTEAFEPAIIDGETKNEFFLRYNIYEDQMEFAKDSEIYYLKKDLNKRIFFKKLNKTYVCLDFNGDLSFFVLQLESDKIGFVTKEIVKFQEAKKAKTGYDEDKPADYRRQNDQHYLVSNNNLYKLPKKKKDFTAFFKSNENAVKKYMKDNKLDYDDVNDLKKIITFNNSL